MSGKYLLDTNVIIALFANETSVKENLAKAEQIFVPVIALAELYFGAFKSTRVEENLSWIDEFSANTVVLGCDGGTAKRYGKIKNALLLGGARFQRMISGLLQLHCNMI